MSKQYQHQQQNNSFEQYCKDKKRQYGELFSTKNLAQQFTPYLYTNTRLKIKDEHGKIHFGSIGVTTGWVPVFLLMHSKRCIGSSFVLNKEHKILAYKEKHKYIPMENHS
jgi:hypothetical protein